MHIASGVLVSVRGLELMQPEKGGSKQTKCRVQIFIELAHCLCSAIHAVSGKNLNYFARFRVIAALWFFWKIPSFVLVILVLTSLGEIVPNTFLMQKGGFFCIYLCIMQETSIEDAVHPQLCNWILGWLGVRLLMSSQFYHLQAMTCLLQVLWSLFSTFWGPQVKA